MYTKEQREERRTAALGEYDAEDVAKGREGNEDGECSFSLLSEHVAEERGRQDAARGDNLVLGHCGKVGNLDEISMMAVVGSDKPDI